MTGSMRWIRALLAQVLLVLILLLAVLPTDVYSQGGPGQGNPPPGQEKPKDQGDEKANNASPGNSGDAVKAVGQLVAQGNNGDQTRLINIRAERLTGLPIINRDGDEIGKVGDVLVNITGRRQSGNPQQPASGGLVNNARADYVLAQFGGLLGWGGESVLVPLTALRLHLVDGQRLGFDDDLAYFEGTAPGDDVREARKEFFNGNALVLASDQDDLDSAPQFDARGLRDVRDPAWDRNLRAYWQGLGAAWPEPAAPDGTAYRVSSVRDLNRFNIRELGGDGLGYIDDVLLTVALGNPTQFPLPPVAAGNDDAGDDNNLLDTDNNDDGDRADAGAAALAASLPIVDARMNYALIGHGGWWGWGARTAPVPVGMLTMDRDYDERTMYLEAGKDLLEDAPAVDSKEGDELNDGNFFTRVRAYWQEAGFGPFEQ